MDGYAVLSSATESASSEVPVAQVAGCSGGGTWFEQPLKPEHAVRIFTGAPVPNKQTPSSFKKIRGTRERDTNSKADPIGRPHPPSWRGCAPSVTAGGSCDGSRRHCHAGGSRAHHGSGHLSAAVAILPTGDELVEAGQPVAPGQIANSNGIMIQSLCVSLGMEPILFPIVRDQKDALRSALLDAAEKSDLILTIGGVSVGDFDHVLSSIEETGTVDFWKVAIKPGKPLAFGNICSTPIIGLPGNPASAFVCFELFARPALLTLAGRPNQRALIVDAKLQRAHRQNPTRDQFLRGRLKQTVDGYHVETASTQGSGQLSSMLDINALARIPSGHGDIDAGQNVSVIALDRYFQG